MCIAFLDPRVLNDREAGGLSEKKEKNIKSEKAAILSFFLTFPLFFLILSSKTSAVS